MSSDISDSESSDLDLHHHSHHSQRLYQQKVRLKGTVSVILSDSPCKDDNAQFKRYPETFNLTKKGEMEKSSFPFLS